MSTFIDFLNEASKRQNAISKIENQMSSFSEHMVNLLVTNVTSDWCDTVTRIKSNINNQRHEAKLTDGTDYTKFITEWYSSNYNTISNKLKHILKKKPDMIQSRELDFNELLKTSIEILTNDGYVCGDDIVHLFAHLKTDSIRKW